jgi:tape measure domain-containing protein
VAFSIKYIYQAVDKFSAVAEKMKQKAGALKNKLDKLGNSFEKTGKNIKSIGKNMTTYGTLPILGLGTAALMSASKIETMEVAFESMLGSQEKAKAMTKELIDFTAKTPFQLEGVASSAKTLLAFGVTQEDMTNKLQLLGDIASGANVPLSDMAQIFGKVKTKGRAYTEELMQLAERGIPIMDVLTKKFGVQKEELFDLASKGKISYTMIEEALQSMTSKGGIFHEQMIKQSKTLAGLFSTLKDNVNIAFAEFGFAAVEALDLKNVMSDLIVKLQESVEWFRQLSPETKKTTVYFTIAAAVIGPLIIGLGMLIMSLKYIAAALGVVATAVTGPIGFFILLGGAVSYLYYKFEWFAKLVNSFSAIITYCLKKAINIGKIFFNKISEYMGMAGQVISDTVSYIGNAIKKVKEFFGFASDNEVRINVKKSVSVDEVKTTSMAKVDLNINDPNNRVGETRTRQTGNMDLNVGRNMAGAYE